MSYHIFSDNKVTYIVISTILIILMKSFKKKKNNPLTYLFLFLYASRYSIYIQYIPDTCNILYIYLVYLCLFVRIGRKFDLSKERMHNLYKKIK